MTRRSYFIGIMFLNLIIIYGCSQGKFETENNKLGEVLKFYDRSIGDYDKIVITTLNGCSGCIAATLYVINNTTMKQGTLYIVSTESKKELNYAVPAYHNKKNLLIDSTAICLKANLVSAHPKIFFIQNGNIVDVNEITAQNYEFLLKLIQE